MDKAEIESKLTVKREGIVYKLNSREAYSGIVFQHYENKKLEFCESYVDGKLEGIKDTYHSNGELASTAIYLNGEKNGPCKKFDIEGKIIEVSNYKNGKLDGLKEVSDNIEDIGFVKQKSFYNDGIIQTLETTYPDSNQIWWKSTFVGNRGKYKYKNESEEVSKDVDLIFFTKNGEIDYVEYHRDGIALDENYKKKKETVINLDAFKKVATKESNKQTINFRNVIKLIIFFSLMAYAVFTFVKFLESL